MCLVLMRHLEWLGAEDPEQRELAERVAVSQP